MIALRKDIFDSKIAHQLGSNKQFIDIIIKFLQNSYSLKVQFNTAWILTNITFVDDDITYDLITQYNLIEICIATINRNINALLSQLQCNDDCEKRDGLPKIYSMRLLDTIGQFLWLLSHCISCQHNDCQLISLTFIESMLNRFKQIGTQIIMNNCHGSQFEEVLEKISWIIWHIVLHHNDDSIDNDNNNNNNNNNNNENVQLDVSIITNKELNCFQVIDCIVLLLTLHPSFDDETGSFPIENEQSSYNDMFHSVFATLSRTFDCFVNDKEKMDHIIDYISSFGNLNINQVNTNENTSVNGDAGNLLFYLVFFVPFLFLLFLFVYNTNYT